MEPIEMYMCKIRDEIRRQLKNDALVPVDFDLFLKSSNGLVFPPDDDDFWVYDLVSIYEKGWEMSEPPKNFVQMKFQSYTDRINKANSETMFRIRVSLKKDPSGHSYVELKSTRYI